MQESKRFLAFIKQQVIVD